MRRHLVFGIVVLLVLASNAETSRAGVKTVEMKIAGYLCGN